MGFDSQLREILHRLPSTRQSLLFSATLPTSVAEFAKAGLNNPVLIRLDSEDKISQDLTMSFFPVKPAEKDAALLVILRRVIQVPRHREDGCQGAQAIVFVATKHHVEYVTVLLQAAGYRAAHIYGSLDQVARQQQLHSFRTGHTDVLVVTDVAARGIDIPVMENVINYSFPTGARVFVHRVGRTARAGRKGAAWSLITREDMPYLFDLEAFLGVSLTDVEVAAFGAIPQILIDDQVEHIAAGLDNTSPDLPALRIVMGKGQSMFERSRSKASQKAYQIAKAFSRRYDHGEENVPVHPAVRFDGSSDIGLARARLLSSVKAYNPLETVFEMGSRGQSSGAILMKARRKVIHKRKLAPGGTVVGDSEGGTREISVSPYLGEVTCTHSMPQTPKSYEDPNFFISHAQDSAKETKGYAARCNSADTASAIRFRMKAHSRVNCRQRLSIWPQTKERRNARKKPVNRVGTARGSNL